MGHAGEVSTATTWLWELAGEPSGLPAGLAQVGQLGTHGAAFCLAQVEEGSTEKEPWGLALQLELLGGTFPPARTSLGVGGTVGGPIPWPQGTNVLLSLIYCHLTVTNHKSAKVRCKSLLPKAIPGLMTC